MKDTGSKVSERLAALYSSLPGRRRLEMACGMFDDAKALALAGIRAREPHADPKELRRRLFLRLFGSDFPPHRIRRILARLEP